MVVTAGVDGEGLASGGGAVRDVAKHATMDRTAPDDEIYIYPTPKVNGTKVETPFLAKLSSPAQACLFPLARSQREKKLFRQCAEQSCYRYLPLSSNKQRHKHFFTEKLLPPWQVLST